MKTNMREELFGSMSNKEIVIEVVGSIAYMIMLGALCGSILLLSS